MDDRVLANLGSDERKLLAVFARHGRDGRAITPASLMAHACFGLDRKRLSEALGKLAGRGLITQGGDDPFIGSPVAYRLVRPLPAGGTEQHPAEEGQAKRR
jgi:pimeloyl-ACP methyl ester carboxylesterase